MFATVVDAVPAAGATQLTLTPVRLALDRQRTRQAEDARLGCPVERHIPASVDRGGGDVDDPVAGLTHHRPRGAAYPDVAHQVHAIVPRTSFEENSRKSAISAMPALLTRTSSRPHMSSAVWTIARADSSSATQLVSATASSPRSRIFCATRSAWARRTPRPSGRTPTSLTTTFAPAPRAASLTSARGSGCRPRR
jgi:hypothetical protein